MIAVTTTAEKRPSPRNRIAHFFGALVLLAITTLPLSAAESILNDQQLAAIHQLPTISPGLNHGWVVQRTQAQQVQATLTYTVNAPQLTAKEWVFIFPQPPTCPNQDSTQLHSQPTSTRTSDTSALRRPLQQCRLPARIKTLRQQATISYTTDLTLYARTLITSPQTATTNVPCPPLSPAEADVFRRPTPSCDYMAPAFVTWKAAQQLTRSDGTSDIAFAQRVCTTLATTYQYSFRPDQDRSAANICTVNETDCGGLSFLFTTTLRSEGIPARVLAGRWATSSTPDLQLNGHSYHQYHVIAEFFAESVGWIPVDCSSALCYDPSPEKLHYFGRDPGNFIVLHIDPDINYDSVLFGPQQTVLAQIPLFWVSGSGSLDNLSTTEQWTVEKQPK